MRVNGDAGKASQGYPAIAHDGDGNLLIVWEDERNIYYSNIYAQKLDANSEKLMVEELVSLVRRDAKSYHQLAQKSNNKSKFVKVRPLYETYFKQVPLKNFDTKENQLEMRFFFADLLYEIGDYPAAAAEYAKVTEGKNASIAAFNRILSYREASKKDKKY